MIFIITVIFIWIDNIVLQYGVFFWNCFSSNFRHFIGNWKRICVYDNNYYLSFSSSSSSSSSFSLVDGCFCGCKTSFCITLLGQVVTQSHVNLKPQKVLKSKCFLLPPTWFDQVFIYSFFNIKKIYYLFHLVELNTHE